MMKKKSVKINAVLNVIKTLVSLAFPLITYSYASRILLPEGMGKISFSNSIVSYFSLIAGIGVATYAIREGAKIRDNRENIRRFTSDLFSINVYATILAYVLLIIACSVVHKLQPYTAIILILSIQIILATLGVNWVCSIFEEFTVQTIVTVVVQIAALIMLFLFVHTPDDINKYALINALAYSGSGIFLFFYSRKMVQFRFLLRPDLSHLPRIMIVFSTTIAATIYISSDVTILGWIAGDRYTGLYGCSANIYKIVKQLLNAITAVVVPRFSYYIGSRQQEKLEQLGNDLINGMLAVCLPAMTGLFCLSRQIIRVFAGEMFVDAETSLRMLSFALVFAVFANFYANCVLLSYRKEMTVMKATVISAAVNIILNFFLIPVLYEKGAALTTIIAELIMCLIVFRKSRKDIRFRIDPRNVAAVLIGCAAIVVICRLAALGIGSSLGIIAAAVSLSVAVYGMIQYLLKNKVFTEGLLNLRKH